MKYTRKTLLKVKAFHPNKGEAVAMCYRKSPQKMMGKKTELCIGKPKPGKEGEVC